MQKKRGLAGPGLRAGFMVLIFTVLTVPGAGKVFSESGGEKNEWLYGTVIKEKNAAAAPEAPGLNAAALPETAESTPPRRESAETPLPPIPEYILGRGLTSAELLADFLVSLNAGAAGFARELTELYVEEASAEGVNHDAAFAQMCLETGYLRFGGLVTPDMNNFCGLGATGPSARGDSFPDPRTGVRAHIQHLKAYATDEFPTRELVDPRYFWIRYGSSPRISGLSGTWAQDPLYADKINGILKNLYRFSFGPRESGNAAGSPEPGRIAAFADKNAEKALEEDTEKLLDKVGVAQ